jgi:hypothetical protein
VKNGRGTYCTDVLDFGVDYELKSKNDWIRSYEVRDGIPHGGGSTWHEGALWSKEQYQKGKLHGVHTLFYDNGRLRTRTTYRNGKSIKTEEFPKYDHPAPAVLLRAEANAELYEAWNQPLLDAYPTPLNLQEVQAQLTIPAFLQQVFERNLANATLDDYEDTNTFNDNIAYHVMISERGTVDSVQYSGSGVYSVGTVKDYPPLIQKLQFEPGRLHGRPVRCRVVVWVEHTFVEADATKG